MIKQDRIIKKFVEMASISSPSLKERKMADYLIKELQDLGIEVYEDKAGEESNGNCGNIIGLLRGKGPLIMFSAHMDTVGPCENVVPVIESDRIKSSGDTVLGGDDKAGIAAILEMLQVIIENSLPHPDILVVFSIAEEIRLQGAKSADLSKYDIKYGFVLDSSGKPGTIVNQAPFHNAIDIVFIGKSAHAGIEPENGINAFYVAAKAVSKMKVGRIDSETTFNPGIVKGGNATNIVMEKMELNCEARSYKEEKLEEVVKEITQICKETAEEMGAKVEFDIKREYNGFYFEDSCEVMQIAKKAAENIGLPFSTHKLGGGSDANVYNEKGIITINLGIGMTKIHSKDEYILINDLVDNARFITEIVKEIK